MYDTHQTKGDSAMPEALNATPGADTTQDATTGGPWAALVAQMRTQIASRYETGDLRSWYDRENTTVLRCGAPTLTRIMFAGWVGYLHCAIAIGGFVAASVIPVVVASNLLVLLVLTGTATAIAALQWLYHHSTAGYVMDISRDPGFYSAFSCAQYEIADAGKQSADAGANADAVLASVGDMAAGYEELLGEYLTLSASHYGASHSSLIRGGYLGALSARQDGLLEDLFDILAEVTAGARLVFSARTDLLVQVASPIGVEDIIDAASTTNRTKAAQDQLSAARARLAALALATLGH